MINFFTIFTLSIKKKFSVSFFIILLLSTLHANAENSNKIGIITEISGTFKALQGISTSGKITDLSPKNQDSLAIYDEVFKGIEYQLLEKSSITLSIDDKSMIRLKGPGTFKTTDFNLEKKSEKFIFEIKGGQFAIESGEISKANGNMIMKLQDSEVKFKGTLVSGDVTGGQFNIFLSPDNFGKTGSVSVAGSGGTQNIDQPNQGLTLTPQGFQDKVMPEASKQEVQIFKTSIIESSKINEKDLTAQLQKKLTNGTLKDSNNDGIVDEADIKAQSDVIKSSKISRIDFILSNTNPEQKNTLLGEILDKSDAQNVGEVMNKIAETKPEAAATVIGSLSEKNNTFITSNTNPALVLIKEKVMNTVIEQGNAESVDAISKYIQATNVDSNNKLMKQITDSAAANPQQTNNMALAVISSIADTNPEKLNTMATNSSESFKQFSQTAVAGAMTGDNQNFETSSIAIASIIGKTNENVSAAFMANITTTAQEVASSGEPGSGVGNNMALAVISSIADTNPEKLNTMATNSSESFKQFSQTAVAGAMTGDNQNFETSSIAIASIIGKTNENVSAAFMANITTTAQEVASSGEPGSGVGNNMALAVISSIADTNPEKLNEIATANSKAFQELASSASATSNSVGLDSQGESQNIIADIMSKTNESVAKAFKEKMEDDKFREIESLAAVKATDQSATDQPATDQPATDQLATDQLATDQLATDQLATDQPATDQLATDQLATDQPATDQLATDQLATDQPATDQLATDQPAIDAADQAADQAAIDAADQAADQAAIDAADQAAIDAADQAAIDAADQAAIDAADQAAIDAADQAAIDTADQAAIDAADQAAIDAADESDEAAIDAAAAQAAADAAGEDNNNISPNV
jgi:hypothetical protein